MLLVKISAGADTETLGLKSEVKVLNLETYVKVNNEKYGVEATTASVKTTAGPEGVKTKVKFAEGKVGNLSTDVKASAKTDAKLEISVGVGPVKFKAGLNLSEGKKALTKVVESAKTYISGKINEITNLLPKF